VAAVNKYHDYYQTWGSAWADLFSQGPAAQVAAAPGPAGGRGVGAAGGGHSMFTWRGLVPPMLAWMTPRLARRGERDTALALAAARHARQKATARARAAAAAGHHRHHHHRGDRRRPLGTIASRPG